MAQLYTIKCPKCGTVFSVSKGVLMSWDFSKPIPDWAKDETPFSCPDCNHSMCVLDDDFHDNVVDRMNADQKQTTTYGY